MSEINLNSLNSLIIFKVLYETGTATRTAKDLGMTQSGVSRSLALLEKNIGISLFNRNKKRLTATPEADELYGEILGLLGNLEEMKHSIVALREFGVSRIRIAAVPGLGFDFVPQVIAAILNINSGYNISFDILTSSEVVRAVEAGQFDVGFVTLPVSSQSLKVEEICNIEAVCLIPAQHPLAQKKEITIHDFKDEHLVITNQPNLSADQLLMQIAEHNINISGKTEANIAGICSLVAHNVGISLVNPITAYDLANLEKIAIRPYSPAINYSFGLVYKRNWAGNQFLKLLRDNIPSIKNNRVQPS